MAERILTIGLRQYLCRLPRHKRTKKAVRYLRERIAHYNKVDVENVRIDTALNSLLVKRYAKSMSPVKLVVNMDKGIAYATDFSLQKKEAPRAAEPKPKAAKEKPDAARAAPAQKSSQQLVK